MIAPLLDVRGATVRYGARPAVTGVSFTVEPGSLLALAGPNGSGKSSLLRAVIGLEPLAEGSIVLTGDPVDGLDIRTRARRAAWMPQDEPAGDNVRAAAYVRYGRHPATGRDAGSREADDGAVTAAMTLAGTAELADRPVWSLSGGERQRVRLARVVAQATPVLLLDEPTAHLDVGHQLDVLDRLRRLARDEHRAVVVALHDLNLAARFADRIAVLARGRLVALGPPADVLSPELLYEVWGIVATLRTDPRSRLPYLIPELPRPLDEGPVRSTPPRPRVHLVAGGGSAADLLPALLAAGYELSAGTLPLFDSDTELADAWHVPTVEEVPFAPLSDAARDQTRRFVAACDAVVVAPFPVGPTNLANLTDLVGAALDRPLLLVAHTPGTPWDFAEGAGERVRAELLAQGGRELPGAAAVVEELRRLLPQPRTTSRGAGAPGGRLIDRPPREGGGGSIG